MTAITEVRELRIVFYSKTGNMLRSFAVFEHDKPVAFGFAGNEVCVALIERPSLWYHAPGNDVSAALREVFSTQLCIITEGEETHVNGMGSQQREGISLT